MNTPMEVIGIVGGIASGKSAVAGHFASLGAAIIDADRIGHQLLEDPDIISTAVSRWGNSVVDGEGRLVRRRLAERVFGDGCEEELAFWTGVTHPRIKRLMQAELATLASAKTPPPAIVLDAALLFEAGWDKLCSTIIFLKVPRELRLQRALERGWSKEEFLAREASQMPIEEKRQKADLVIDNSAALEETYKCVADVWVRLSNHHP